MGETVDNIQDPQTGNGQPDQGGVEPARAYYDYLKKNGADTPDTYESFRKTLSDSASSRKYFDYLKTEGFDTPTTYESFSKTLGTATSSLPDHHLTHTNVTDLRYLQGQLKPPETNLLSSIPGAAPELDATKQKQNQDLYASKLSDLSGEMGAAPTDVSKVMNDFPLENDNENLKSHVKLLNDNPAAYERFKAADENMKMLGSVDVHAANEYNHQQDVPSGNLSDLQNNIAYQKDIINRTLTGDKRDKALLNLQINRAPSFNILNPELRTGQNESFADLNDYQYAGLKTLENFDSGRYKTYTDILKSENNSTDLSPDEKIGLEKVKKDLNDIGKTNTLKYLQEHQFALNQQFQNATSEDERDQIRNQFVQNQKLIDQTNDDSKNDAARFPYLKDLEFDRQARELMGKPDQGILGFMKGRIARGVSNTVNTLENVTIDLFGSDKSKAQNEAERLGEAESDKATDYLPEGYKDPGLVKYTFDKKLIDAADEIKNNDSLTDQQKTFLISAVVSKNQDKVHTITNPEFGKSANFFSKATIYKGAGMVADLAGIAVQQAALGGVGAPKLIAAMTPMFLTTQNDFYKQGLEEGVANPSQYALTHAAVMMAAGAINPDLNIVKRSLGINTELGKVIAGVDEKTWDNIVKANRPVVNKIAKSISGVGKEALKMGAVYGAGTSLANDIANRGLFNQKISGEEMIDHAVKSTKDILISSLPLLGMHGIMNFKNVSPEEKGMLFDLGSNTKLSLEKIDHLVKTGEITNETGEQRKNLIKQIGKLVEKTPAEDAKGNPLTDKQRAQWLYNSIIKNKINEIAPDLPEAHGEKLEGQKTAIDIENGGILDPKSVKPAIEKELADLKFSEGQLQMKAYEGKGAELRKYIQEQVTGLTSDGKFHEAGGAKNAVQLLESQGIPEHLIEAVISSMPDEDKIHVNDMNKVYEKEPSYKVKQWLRVDNIEKPEISLIKPEDNKEPNIVNPKTEENAVQVNPTGEVGAHTGGGESSGGSVEGSRVGSGQQGNEPTQKSQENQNQGQVQKSVADQIKDLEAERDSRITTETKPKAKLTLLTGDQLAEAKDEPGALKEHKEIKYDYGELKKLINCLWN